MAINLNDNLKILAPKPTDTRYGPWSSTSEANTNVGSLVRHSGLTVGILTPSGVVEYWYAVAFLTQT